MNCSQRVLSRENKEGVDELYMKYDTGIYSRRRLNGGVWLCCKWSTLAEVTIVNKVNQGCNTEKKV